MKHSQITIAAVASLLLTSCVAPIAHTYFVPNPSDGVPVKSSSCGFLQNNKDSLARDIGGLHINVSPTYLSDGKLTVTILLRYPSQNITFHPAKVEVRETSKNVVLVSNNTHVSSYGPDPGHPQYNLWVTLSFPVTASNVDALSVSIPHGALFVGDREIDLEPFRFKQGTSTDMYYASINC